jgi:hypothetical protein
MRHFHLSSLLALLITFVLFSCNKKQTVPVSVSQHSTTKTRAVSHLALSPVVTGAGITVFNMYQYASTTGGTYNYTDKGTFASSAGNLPNVTGIAYHTQTAMVYVLSKPVTGGDWELYQCGLNTPGACILVGRFSGTAGSTLTDVEYDKINLVYYALRRETNAVASTVIRFTHAAIPNSAASIPFTTSAPYYTSIPGLSTTNINISGIATDIYGFQYLLGSGITTPNANHAFLFKWNVNGPAGGVTAGTALFSTTVPSGALKGENGVCYDGNNNLFILGGTSNVPVTHEVELSIAQIGTNPVLTWMYSSQGSSRLYFIDFAEVC